MCVCVGGGVRGNFLVHARNQTVGEPCTHNLSAFPLIREWILCAIHCFCSNNHTCSPPPFTIRPIPPIPTLTIPIPACFSPLQKKKQKHTHTHWHCSVRVRRQARRTPSRPCPPLRAAAQIWPTATVEPHTCTCCRKALAGWIKGGFSFLGLTGNIGSTIFRFGAAA